MQTPTTQQGAPQNPGKPAPKRRKRGKKRETQGATPKRENQTREGNQGAPRISPSRANFPRLVQVWACAVPWGGISAPSAAVPPPGCVAHPFRMAAVLAGVPEAGVVPQHHEAPFAMSSMRLSAAASGFRRISSQMALETWPVWVVWLNLNLGTFWSTMETSRNGAEGSTRR